MEHCPLCDKDTPVTTIATKPIVNGFVGQPVLEYRCHDCQIKWKPNRSDEYTWVDRFARTV